MWDTEAIIICCFDKYRWNRTKRIDFAFISVISNWHMKCTVLWVRVKLGKTTFNLHTISVYSMLIHNDLWQSQASRWLRKPFLLIWYKRYEQCIKVMNNVRFLKRRSPHMPNVRALSLTVEYLWAMLKFLESMPTVTIKVACSKIMVAPERSCHRKHTCQIWKPYV